MAGVEVVQNSAPGGAPQIRVRGVSSFTNSDPCYVVDGLIMDNISFLNPNEVESMEVLKDASATAIYGSRGANGVILITTKQAKKGAPMVKLSANFGIQSATYVPDVVTDPIQYMNMRNQAELNEGKLTVTYNRDDILEYEEGMKHDKYIYPASDWYDLCYQNGFLQQYNARVSGGTDKISYSLGGGYMNQRGIMVANDDVAADDMRKSVLRMAAPAGIKTSIIPVERAAKQILEGKYAGQRVFLIVNKPADIIRLMDLGLPIKTINIGNMGGKDDTKPIKKYVNVTDEQEQQFRDLLAKGVEITTQLVPQDPVTHLTDYLK